MADEQLQPDGEQVTARVGDAIAGVLGELEGGFVLKWVALIESSDPSGERGLWTLTSDNMKSWDTTGLLKHALDLQQAQILAEVISER